MFRPALALALAAFALLALAPAEAGHVTCASADTCITGTFVGGWNPALATASVGSWVVWTSADGLPHPVALHDGTTLHQSSGSQSAWQVSGVGVFAYRCSVHANMQGVLVGR